jgi:hypothetical protein
MRISSICKFTPFFLIDKIQKNKFASFQNHKEPQEPTNFSSLLKIWMRFFDEVIKNTIFVRY